MAIGTSIVDSVPAVGTTVHTLDKFQAGIYCAEIETGDVDTLIRLELRPSSIGSTTRKIGSSWKFNPASTDAPGSQTKGRVTITLNVDAALGTVVTRAALLNHIRWHMGALLKATLLEALVDGSLE